MDDSAISEISLILLLVLGIIVAIALFAGGITLIVALFFGGSLGKALFLFVLAGASLTASLFLKGFAKIGRYGMYLFAALGLVFLILGALGR